MKTQTITKTITKHQQSVPTPLLDKIIEEHEQRKHKRVIRRRRMVERYLTMHEALKIGARRYRQAFDALVEIDSSVCAMGMLGKVTGMTDRDLNDSSEEEIAERFTIPNHMVTCPSSGCCRLTSSLMNAIVHLNDEHRWTGGRIAAWLKKQYPEIQTKKKIKILTTVTEEVEA